MSQREQRESLYRVKLKEGTHLASSQDTRGTFRGTLYDDETNKLVGHAELEKVNESEFGCDYSYDYALDQQKVELSPETQELAEALVEALLVLGAIAVKEHIAPRVNRWLQNKVIPTMKERWEFLADRKKDKLSLKDKKTSDLHTNEIATSDEIVQDIFSHELEEAYEKYINDMTSEEAQRELLDIFILSALLTAKIRKLSNARIIDNGDAPTEYLEGQKILERLTTPEYVNCINQILGNNPQLLKEKTAGLSGILGRNLVLNGQYVPIEVGNFKEAMILRSASA